MLISNHTLNPEFKKIGRILVRGVNWVGDTILTYPSIRGLRDLFPHARISVLAAAHLVELWKAVPHVDEIIPFRNGRGGGSAWEDLRLRRTLKKGRFDLAVIFPRSFRSAWPVFLAGIPIRIGYQDEGRSLLLTHKIPRGEEVLRLHRVHYYLKLLEPLGHLGLVPSLRLVPREEDRDWAEKRLGGLGLLDGRPLVGINPGAAYGLAKCWHPDRFAEVGRRLSEKRKAAALIFGRREEQDIANEILKSLGSGGVNFAGETHLLQLASLLERCHLLVTNDTGTMHVASAVGTPVVAIFGSTDPVTTGPWGDGHVVLRREVPCSPCLKRVCPTDHRCMKLVTVDEVEEAVEKKLRGLLNNQTPSTNHQINSNNQ